MPYLYETHVAMVACHGITLAECVKVNAEIKENHQASEVAMGLLHSIGDIS